MKKLLLILSTFVCINSFGQTPMYKLLAKKASSCAYLLDTYTGASVAYSLRLLDCDYAGNCIRVRRSSDNTEQNISFSGGVVDTASMKTFVGTGGTDDGFVVTWYDQSGNANDATQASAPQQAKIMDNGVVLREGTYPTLTFSGINYYGFTNIESNDANWSLFSVFKRSSTAHYGFTLSGEGQGPLVTQNNDNNLYVQRCVTGTDKYASSADATATFHIQTAVVLTSGTTIAAWKNGSAYTMSGESNFTATNTNFKTIGYYSSSSYTFTGNMSEVILYMSDKTSSRTGIESNINTYYTIY